MEGFYEFVRSSWTLWLMGLFAGIVVWVFWPRRKGSLEDHASIPLHDDEPGKED